MSTSAPARREARPALDETSVPLTGTFLDQLPLTAPASESTERVSFYGTDPTRTVTVITGFRTEQTGLFRSLEGSPTHERTDRVSFAGQERYLIHNRKIRGVLRSVHRDLLAAEDCRPSEACTECASCSLFGYLATGNDGRSRIELMDAWSVHPAEGQLQYARTTGEAPMIRQTEVVPVGTLFVGGFRMRVPSRRDLADVLMALERACALGVGARTTTHGSLHMEPLAMVGGAWRGLGSVWKVLEERDRADIDLGLAAERALAGGGPEENLLVGEALACATETLLRCSPLHFGYGSWPEASTS